MGRRRIYRDFPLWVRLKKENLEFLDKVCHKSKTNRTEFIDLHLEFLRANMPLRKAATLVSKTGNEVSSKDKAQA